MDSFFKMVDVQTVLFIYMAVGFFCRKKGIFNDAARDKLTDFVVLITLPCMIFESFHMEFSLESLKQGGRGRPHRHRHGRGGPAAGQGALQPLSL